MVAAALTAEALRTTTMGISPLHRANGTKSAKRQRLRLSRHALRCLAAKRSGKKAIPDSIIEALAASRLPKNKRSYNARLRELLRAA